MLKRLAFVLACALLLPAMKCSESDCDKAKAEVEKACAGNPQASECRIAKIAMELACAPKPTPQPTATPTATPTPEPTPTPLDCRKTMCQPGYHCEQGQGCVPDPPAVDEVEKACGQPMPANAWAWIRAKPYGQGIDTEVNVVYWPDLCVAIHGNPVNPNQCHLEGHQNRVECEMAIINKLSGGKGYCPVAQWYTATHQSAAPLLQRDPYESGGMSGDHWGDTSQRDDPQTPAVFEGTPKVCGEQRDHDGDPMAGFFFVAHGDGYVRACLPNYEGCSKSWVRVVH